LSFSDFDGPLSGYEQEWDEAARLNWLQSELNNRRPLFRIRDIEANTIGLDPDIRKTLMVYKVASELEPESLGAYVISQANTASDVLAVMLLQKQFGMTSANGKLVSTIDRALDVSAYDVNHDE
jgi:phosphoenolpyruvate carboxylase